MLLWIAMAILTAAASLTVLMPLYRARRTAASAPELAIYRDQLRELDREVGDGLVPAGEANAARTEISRRLLRAADSATGVDPKSNTLRRLAAIVAIVAIPLGAIGLYLVLGSPTLPDQPLAARLAAPPDTQDVPALVARVESHLAKNPDDGRGWELLGPVYLRLGRNDDAAKAFANTIRTLGSTSEREANLGEAIVRANDGTVTGDARKAFERAGVLDPKSVRPRFYLALALGQDGRKEEAVAAWKALLAEAPAGGAAWADVARSALAELEAPAGAPTPGPTADDVRAASDMSAEDRQAMIAGMVETLSERLKSDPGDADGWARLVRSYMVLGDKPKAEEALARARLALAQDPAKLSIVESEAKEKGLLR
jgi:cytochrome c-type biogenesis protein CcmH